MIGTSKEYLEATNMLLLNGYSAMDSFEILRVDYPCIKKSYVYRRRDLLIKKGLLEKKDIIVGEFSVDEIARALGLKSRQVNVILERAMEKISILMERDGVNPGVWMDDVRCDFEGRYVSHYEGDL